MKIKFNIETLHNILKLTALSLIVAALAYMAFEQCKRASSPHAVQPEKATAFILVKPGTVTSQWHYQDLKMRECAWCKRAVNLNRHHVVPQAANPMLTHVRENLIVLCRDCHFVLGHRCNWKQYNPDVMEICAVFTNCVKSSDTRAALENRDKPRTTEEVKQAPVLRSTPSVPYNKAPKPIYTDNILHVTNDVPEGQRSALERILRSKDNFDRGAGWTQK